MSRWCNVSLVRHGFAKSTSYRFLQRLENHGKPELMPAANQRVDRKYEPEPPVAAGRWLGPT